VIKSVFHVNINVTDFDRSMAFYKLLGFKVALDLGDGPNHGNEKIGPVTRHQEWCLEQPGHRRFTRRHRNRRRPGRIER
jgi:catechol 2,3-dioxygenase-like lactoylglutathione lyase family enzyme